MDFGNVLAKELHQFMMEEKDGEKKSPYTFVRKLSDFEFEVELKDADRFSFLINSFQVRAWKDVPEVNLKVQELRKRAESLARRVTYFLENLRLLEVDPIKLQVQMRSEEPEHDDKTLSYYEVMIQENSTISLHRFEFSKLDKERRQIPFLVTQEVFGKFVDDFVAVLPR